MRKCWCKHPTISFRLAPWKVSALGQCWWNPLAAWRFHHAEARTFKGPTPATLRHLSPLCSAQCDITNNASPPPGCPCVCLKYCPHNVHKAPETNQGPPLVCQTHSCVDNALIIDYTLLSASPWTASITPPVDPPSPHSPSVFTVHGLQGFFYSFPLPRAGAQDFGDSEGNKSISLGSDSLCTWAERSQLGQRLVSLTKQPELSDGGGGLATGMAKRANVGRLGWCSQGSAGRHRRAKTGRNITSMFQIRRATQQQRRGETEKGTNYFASLACKHACLFVCKLVRKKLQRISIIIPF